MALATTSTDIRGRDDSSLTLARLSGLVLFSAGAAGDAVFALRNTHATNNILVTILGFRAFFAGAAAPTNQFYQVFRFTGASLTGGTQLTAAQIDNGGTPPPSYDARIGTGAAALSVTNVVFEANALFTVGQPRQPSVTAIDNLLMNGTIALKPGEGIAVKMQVGFVLNDGFAINIAMANDVPR